MQIVVANGQMRELDKRAQESVCSSLLMENAAILFWLEVERHVPNLSKESRILFLSGPGGNGGDALAAARFASCRGYRHIQCACMGQGGEERRMLSPFPVGFLAWEAQTIDADVIVDGLFGVGLNRPLEGIAASLVEQANASKGYRVAIDVPSGLSDTLTPSLSFHADLTVAMALPKLACFHPRTASSVGALVTVNPSFPPKLLAEVPSPYALVAKEEVTIPRLSSDAYKKTRGSLAVYAGSLRYSGAAVLCCRSAFHARCGLVTLLTDGDYAPVAASSLPSVMVRPYEEGEAVPSCDAILAGPGWGKEREKELEDILSQGKPLVLDADGISCFASLWKQTKKPFDVPTVLTPHIGELAALSAAVLGRDITRSSPLEFFASLRELSQALHAVLLVKSSLNHIASEEGVTVLPGNNPSLGVAGSGDVLSGIAASMLSSGLRAKDAALAASALHQRVGEMARKQYGYYESASLIPLIGTCMEGMEA